MKSYEFFHVAYYLFLGNNLSLHRSPGHELFLLRHMVCRFAFPPRLDRCHEDMGYRWKIVAGGMFPRGKQLLEMKT